MIGQTLYKFNIYFTKYKSFSSIIKSDIKTSLIESKNIEILENIFSYVFSLLSFIDYKILLYYS